MSTANSTEETCTGTGDTLTLTGATAGYVPFSKQFADGDPVTYYVADSGGSILVTGIGTYNSAGTITRADRWNYNGTVADENPSTNIALSAGSHIIGCNQSKKERLDYYAESLPAGRFKLPHNIIRYAFDGKGGGEFSSLAGRLMLTPVMFFYPQKITEIGANISTVSAGGNFRVGLYKANPDGTPGALIFDSGDISTAAAVITTATLATPVIISPGCYFFADMVDNTVATARGARTDHEFIGFHTGTIGDDPTQKPYYDLTYGALPATLAAIGAGFVKYASFGALFR